MKQGIRNLRDFQSWEKAWLRVFEKEGLRVYVVCQYNPFYGDLVTSFQIGEDPEHTGVQDKFIPEWVIEFTESSSLCGVREFERGSITYEFLWKPLGLDPDNPPVHKISGWDPLFTGFYEIKGRMLANGWALLPER